MKKIGDPNPGADDDDFLAAGEAVAGADIAAGATSGSVELGWGRGF
jgi:hypothetical protein